LSLDCSVPVVLACSFDFLLIVVVEEFLVFSLSGAERSGDWRVAASRVRGSRRDL